MISKKFSIFVATFIGCGLCFAGGLAEFDVFLKSTEAGTLNFTQNIIRKKFDGTPRNIESKARLEFHRPLSFRLEYAPPNDYVFAADGVTLTMHDPLLNSTTTHDQSTLMGKELLALMSSRSIEALQSEYDLRENSANGLDWVIVTPRATNNVIFTKILLGFQRNELTRLETVDAHGDRNVYRISWESLAIPDVSRFKFSPPAGSDYEDKSEVSKPNSTSEVIRE